MVVEIRISPRKLERAVLLIIIIFLLAALYYYGYSQCSAAPVAAEKINNTPAAVAPARAEEVKEISVPAIVEPVKTSGAADGKIAVSVADLKYITKQVEDKQKFTVESFDILIKNGMSSTQTGITVDVYHYDANMDTDEVNLYLTKAENGNPVPIEPIPAGITISRNIPIKTPKSMWEKGVLNTYKFVFKQNGVKIEEITKTVKP